MHTKRKGIFFLWTEFIKGVPLEELELKVADQEKVLPQVMKYIKKLQTPQSNKSGGPSSHYTQLEYADTSYPQRNTAWKFISMTKDGFVFCHGDLSQ